MSVRGFYKGLMLFQVISTIVYLLSAESIVAKLIIICMAIATILFIGNQIEKLDE